MISQYNNQLKSNIFTIMFKYLTKLRDSLKTTLDQAVMRNKYLRSFIPMRFRLQQMQASYLKQQPKPAKQSEAHFEQEKIEDESRRTRWIRWAITGVGLGLVMKYGYDLYHNWFIETSWHEFQELLKNEDIKNIVVKKHGHDYHAYIYTYVRKYHFIVGDINNFNEVLAKNIPVKYENVTESFIIAENVSKMLSMTANVLIIGIACSVIWNLLRKGPQAIANVQMKRQSIIPVTPKTRFKDVAGCDESKLEITEFVEFLKSPQKFHKLGAKIPRGALLFGPPGTGKTLLAKACAGEAEVPFFATSGSQFAELFVGSGPARVRQLFAQAKKKTPSIIFIDEIDSIARSRNSSGDSANDERANTLNQILVEMDGFGTHAEVIVMAATNRKELLDSAITRPGRFDRLIEINLPDIEGRRDILMIHLKPINLEPSIPIEQYARRLSVLTPGFSGADLQNLCNEAALIAVRNKKRHVSKLQFEIASERVIGGVEKTKLINQKERKVVAYHECGHAVTSWFLKGADPLLKISIIPRSKGALGFAQYLPSETQLYTKQQILDKICVILGGRYAQNHFFNQITTGAADDLQKAYKWARLLVTKFGMSERIGLLSLEDNDSVKEYSEEVNQIIDEEISRIINQCSEVTKKIIEEHADKIRALAERLIDLETIDTAVIQDVLGARPFEAKKNYRKYLEEIKNAHP